MNMPYFIAEIGINHNKDMQIIKRLIDATFACGWDCVKFQKKTPKLCVPENQKDIMKETPWGKMTYLEYKHIMELNKDDYNFIDSYCKEKPIDWTTSVWDLPSLKFISSYNVPFIKIPSAKLTDYELLTVAAQTGKKIILSIGMSTWNEIDVAVQILKIHAKDYALLHCNSAYPAPLGDLNLSLIPQLKKRYGCKIGYSGHEYNIEPTIVAVALGAEIIERHITLDHEMWGTDQAASLEIEAMDVLRKRVKSICLALGDGIKKLTEKELEILKKLRG